MKLVTGGCWLQTNLRNHVTNMVKNSKIFQKFKKAVDCGKFFNSASNCPINNNTIRVSVSKISPKTTICLPFLSEKWCEKGSHRWGFSLIMGRLFDFFVRSRKVIIVIWVLRRCGGCSTVAVPTWKSARVTAWGWDIDVRNRSLSLLFCQKLIT